MALIEVIMKTALVTLAISQAVSQCASMPTEADLQQQKIQKQILRQQKIDYYECIAYGGSYCNDSPTDCRLFSDGELICK